jgi:hypothetical protein
MKQTYYILLSLLLFTACEKVAIDDDDLGNVRLSFVPTTSDTRATVAIGDYFTKLNVMLFDVDGAKVFDKVRTQTSADTDFGTLNLSLAAGTYTAVAVGHSSAVSATIKSPEMVQFTAKDGEKLTDTFCYCGRVTISEDGGTHELRMNRVTAMVRLRLTDTQMPQSFARLKVDYSGGSANFNPTTFEGCTKSSQSETRTAPATEYYFFTFPYLARSGYLKMTLSALTADGTVLCQKTISEVPVTRNRITTYSGTLFDDAPGDITQTAFGITVNPQWDGEDFYHFSRPVTFTVSGDFTCTPMTRSLTADGRDMTDIWVLDYPEGSTAPSAVIHQTSADADFGTPTMTLSLGTHHLYFVASRGSEPVLDTDAHIITFGTVRDTFWKDLALSVTATSSGSCAVALDRVVTKLRVNITDLVPPACASLTVTPSTWYSGIDYLTADPVSYVQSGDVLVAVPATYAGTTGQLNISIFGFSSADEWTTDIALTAKDTDGSTVGQATILSAPFRRNRLTEYSGPLFSKSPAMSLSLNSDWLDDYTASWQ